jgi:hypothetical protein
MGPRVCILVPGLGHPCIEQKLATLQSNLDRIAATGWDWRAIVCCYSPDVPIHVAEGGRIRLVREPGVVAQFIKRHAKPSRAFDYYVITLDDVLWNADLDPNGMLRYLDELRLDIVSPSLDARSVINWSYMQSVGVARPTLEIVSRCELFCYFMTRAAFEKYWTILDMDHPWLWGIDLMLDEPLALRVGLVRHMTVQHWGGQMSYKDRPEYDPCQGMYAFLAKHGYTYQELFDRPIVRYVVHPQDQAIVGEKMTDGSQQHTGRGA